MNKADIEMGKAIVLAHRISQKKEQIRNVTNRRCGNCDLWMKSTCKPEKEQGKFISVGSFACSAFRFDPGSVMLKEKFEAELTEMQIGKPIEGASDEVSR